MIYSNIDSRMSTRRAFIIRKAVTSKPKSQAATTIEEKSGKKKALKQTEK